MASQRRHERFYFADGNVTFQVQNILYRVHRYFFERDSVVFAGMFTLPDTPGHQQDGSCDGQPISLHKEEPADFEAFLSILYPSTFLEQCSVEEWSSCLRFAHKFQFTVQEKLAIAKLSDIASPIDKIILGRMYEEASGWLVQAFVDMARRDEPPTRPEGRRLGIDDLVLIGQLRHRLHHFPHTYGDTRFVETALATPEEVMQINEQRFFLMMNNTRKWKI